MNQEGVYARTWFGGSLLVALTGLLAFLFPSEAERSSGTNVRTTVAAAASTDEQRQRLYSAEGSLSLESVKWDDPYCGLNDEELLQRFPTSNRSLTNIRAILKSRIGANALMVMPVFCGDGSTITQIENRRRTRHAFELAMVNQQFNLAYPDRMTFVQVDYTIAMDGPTGCVAESRPMVVPLKLYRHADQKHFVLALWIRDEDLGGQPLSTTLQIASQFVVDDGGASMFAPERVGLCLNSPVWSDTLSKMVTEASHAQLPPQVPEQLPTLQRLDRFGLGSLIMNTVCTADNSSIGIGKGSNILAEIDIDEFDSAEPTDSLPSWLSLLGMPAPATSNDESQVNSAPPASRARRLRLVHTIGEDSKLIARLKNELLIRGALPGPSGTRKMVLFVEQSSRAYIQNLQTAFSRSGSGDQRIAVVPFLEGMAESAQENSRQQIELSDYLDRTMNELLDGYRVDGLRPDEVSAVGIFGSRWADKHWILSKVRKAFPSAVFFTTELDSRDCLPGFNEPTRNMVVASHYGLRIAGSEQQLGRVDNIPSFREGYQTSTFLGTSIAVMAFRQGRLDSDQLQVQTDNGSQDLFDVTGRISSVRSLTDLEPLVFEIGTHSPVQLPAGELMRTLAVHQPDSAVSLVRQPFFFLELLLATAIIGGAFVTLAPYSRELTLIRRRLRMFLRQLGKTLSTTQTRGVHTILRGNGGLLFAICFGLLLAAMIAFNELQYDSEPFLFRNGISIWPSLLLLSLVLNANVLYLAKRFRRPGREDPPAYHVLVPALVLALMLLVFTLVEQGGVNPPARGLLLRLFAAVVVWTSTASVLAVVFDASLFSVSVRKDIAKRRRSVRNTTDAKHHSPNQPSGRKFVGDQMSAITSDCRAVMDESIRSSKRLIFPAITSVLFFVARFPVWDAWSLSTSAWTVLVLPLLTAIGIALVVRWSAISYRNEAIEHLHHFRSMLPPGGNHTALARHGIDGALDTMKALHRGPFGPISQDWLLGACFLILSVLAVRPVGNVVNYLSWYFS